ncbi:MAG: hypothetical protein RIC52_07525, partial [Amphiplicatus sp.]
MDLKEEHAIGGDPERHWYYISKARAIKTLIGSEPVESLVDVGAGSGVFSRMLIEQGVAKRSVCVDPNYEDEWIGSRRTDSISYLRAIERVGAP